MPSLSPPQLQSLAQGLPAQVADKLMPALRAQDSHNVGVAQALGNALVLGDTVRVFTPYTAAAPLAVVATGGIPTCFPFEVLWPRPADPVLVIAQAMDALHQSSPANLNLALPDWVMVTKGGRRFIRIRNIGGLVTGSFAITLVAL